MSAQAIENQAIIVGTLRDLSGNETLPSHTVATVDVEAVSSVPGYPNLFAWTVGHPVQVNVPAEKATFNQRVGEKVSWRVKRTGPTTAFLLPER